MDGNIKFALQTGVTKFGKVSVFSDLNNLNDISMSEQYIALCGTTSFTSFFVFEIFESFMILRYYASWNDYPQKNYQNKNKRNN